MDDGSGKARIYIESGWRWSQVHPAGRMTVRAKQESILSQVGGGVRFVRPAGWMTGSGKARIYIESGWRTDDGYGRSQGLLHLHPQKYIGAESGVASFSSPKAFINPGKARIYIESGWRTDDCYGRSQGLLHLHPQKYTGAESRVASFSSPKAFIYRLE